MLTNRRENKHGHTYVGVVGVDFLVDQGGLHGLREAVRVRRVTSGVRDTDDDQQRDEQCLQGGRRSCG